MTKIHRGKQTEVFDSIHHFQLFTKKLQRTSLTVIFTRVTRWPCSAEHKEHTCAEGNRKYTVCMLKSFSAVRISVSVNQSLSSSIICDHSINQQS